VKVCFDFLIDELDLSGDRSFSKSLFGLLLTGGGFLFSKFSRVLFGEDDLFVDGLSYSFANSTTVFELRGSIRNSSISSLLKGLSEKVSLSRMRFVRKSLSRFETGFLVRMTA